MPAPHPGAAAAPQLEIRALTGADAHWHLEGLCALLEDGVRTGTSLGFLAPLERREAERDWQELQPALSDTNLLWIAREGECILGCVRLRLAASADARHRATVERLVVLSTHRRRGIARALLAAAAGEALERGRTLLVLDVEAASDAARALQRLGWEAAGSIPAYAAGPDGTLRDGARLFRRLAPGAR
jgi:acetyltransferase